MQDEKKGICGRQRRVQCFWMNSTMISHGERPQRKSGHHLDPKVISLNTFLWGLGFVL